MNNSNPLSPDKGSDVNVIGFLSLISRDNKISLRTGSKIALDFSADESKLNRLPLPSNINLLSDAPPVRIWFIRLAVRLTLSSDVISASLNP